MWTDSEHTDTVEVLSAWQAALFRADYTEDHVTGLTEGRTTYAGTTGVARPTSVLSDDVVAVGILLLCLMATSLVYRGRHKLSEDTEQFFHPRTDQKEQRRNLTTEEAWCQILMVLMVSLSAGLLLLYYTSRSGFLGAWQWPAWLVALVGSGAYLILFLLKWGVLSAVNGLFFAPGSRKKWNESFLYIFSAANVFVLPAVVVASYLDVCTKNVTIWLLITLSMVEFALFWKAYRVFFNKKHGILHLFVYLCTLEIAPLLVMWQMGRYLVQYF